MSVENQLPSRQTGSQRDRIEGTRSLSRYDLLLSAIPVPLLLGATTALLAGVPPEGGVAGGGVVAALLVAYGLFVDPPRDP